MSVPPELTISIAALHASLHGIRMAANGGIVSPSDIDESLEGVLETLENLPAEYLTLLQTQLDPQFVEIRRSAKANWKKS